MTWAMFAVLWGLLGILTACVVISRIEPEASRHERLAMGLAIILVAIPFWPVLLIMTLWNAWNHRRQR